MRTRRRRADAHAHVRVLALPPHTHRPPPRTRMCTQVGGICAGKSTVAAWLQEHVRAPWRTRRCARDGGRRGTHNGSACARTGNPVRTRPRPQKGVPLVSGDAEGHAAYAPGTACYHEVRRRRDRRSSAARSMRADAAGTRTCAVLVARRLRPPPTPPRPHVARSWPRLGPVSWWPRPARSTGARWGPLSLQTDPRHATRLLIAAPVPADADAAERRSHAPQRGRVPSWSCSTASCGPRSARASRQLSRG